MTASEEVLPWLKSLPVAPEYRPTEAEFQNPIAYIFKIEKEASQYGICKIIPPLPPSPKKTATANLTRSHPTFTTRQQQIGFCPRRAQPVRRRVWYSGHHYSLREFEAKAKAFHKTYLKKSKPKPSPLELETLYWKATLDKPFSVEYANDIPGSAFSPLRALRDADYVGDTAWNMRAVSRGSDSLLKFMKEEIPGVTSPMVYVAMLFSWFAWHVEDHDLHSLNYLHFGAPKTWYGVPKDAAVAFEEVVRVHGYGGEINPLVTFAILGEKTTVMSPEVFVGAGVPCCRLVQNAGEFVVTFPRAYHTGFSHGFNCGEAANIATPEWLRFAKDAAIRRASINYPPMVSHFQLLYDLGLALCSRIPGGIRAEPRSSRLKYKRNGEGETVIKELFVQDVVENNDLLHTLSKGSAIVLLPRSSSDFSVCSKLRVGSRQLKVNPDFSLNVYNYEGMDSSDFISNDLMFNRNHGIKQVKSFYSVKEKFVTLCERNRVLPLNSNGNIYTSSSKTLQGDSEKETDQGDGLSDHRLFSCVTCGILSFSCVAIVQPREPAATYLMSADCSFFNDWIVGSGVTSNKFSIAHEDASIPKPKTYTGWTKQNAQHDSNSVPIQSVEHHAQIADQNYEEALNSEREKGNTALALLASAYGNSSDSEEDQGELDIALDGDELNAVNHSASNGSQEMSSMPSHFQDPHTSPMVRVIRLNKGDDIHSRRIDNYEHYMHKRLEQIMTPFDYSVKSEDHDNTSGVAFRNTRAVPHPTLNCSQDTHTDEDSSRMHIFCLEHAVEAEQQLRPIGGAHILLLCHPDYPKIEAEAKFVAEELGIGYTWKNTVYKQANREDEERIQSALDSEEAIPGNGDWAVKLGINLFYSANLSRSALYSKQIPYNSVIYKAFGQSSPASSPTEPKVYQRRTNKQKKVVAGKWCGKVWMSNQVHPLLAKRDSEDVEDETSLHGWPLPDEKIQRSESNHKSNTSTQKSGKKWKKSVEKGGIWEESFVERDWLSESSIEDKFNKYQRRIIGGKCSRHIERDDTASEGHYSPLPLHRKPITKHSESSENDGMSDDLLDDDSCIQHRRRANTNEAKLIDSDVFSDDTMDYGSDWLRRGELSNEQDAISDDSLSAGSLQLHGKIPIGKYDKYITEEDVISDDDQREVCLWKRRGKISKCRQRSLSAKSDDGLKHHRQKQQQKNLRSRQDKYFAVENITSDDQMEGHFFKCQRRIPKNKQVKFIEEEDVMSDDQLKGDFQKPQRSTRRSRQNKCNDKDVMNDLAENNFHILYRTRKRKQVKGMDEDNIDSDDQMDDILHQRHKRTLQSKQSKAQILQQTKQTNPHHARNKTSHPAKQKQGAHTKMKSKAARQTKNQSGNSKDLTLHVKEEEDGGPRTRLRKRVLERESEGKLKEKRTKREKEKNTTAAKVLVGHAKTKDEESEYQCDVEGCTMSFGSKQELLQHKRNICPVKGCGKKFFSHKYLVQHRRVHEDDRPLKCPWKGCKMSFKWAWARTEHIRVHTGARPYVCAEPGCGQTFRFVSDFSRHKRRTGHATKKNC